MHPNPLFRSDDHAMMAGLVEDIGFGMIFCQTPDGPRVAHAPLMSAGEGKWRFHLARANALSGHLDGATALVTVNGPHGYVSPRWYANRDTVPTWDYVAIEMEGPVKQLSEEELDAMLYEMVDHHEGRLGGEAWQSDEASPDMWAKLLKGITGFEIEAQIVRPTFKLSQKKSPAEREAIASGVEAAGNDSLAKVMRGFAS